MAGSMMGSPQPTQNKGLWWGYEHVNGSIQAKRFSEDRDIEDAKESDFVKRVSTRFWATSRGHALEQLKRRFNSIETARKPRLKLSF
jgi:hypothetical protein